MSAAQAAVGACAFGDASLLGNLVASRAIDANGADESGSRFLVVAAQHGHETCVRGLLQCHANANERDKDGETALAVAAHAGHSAVVLLLCESRADPNLATLSGEAPLHWAAYSGSATSCRTLLAAAADVMARDNDGTALETASRRGYECVVALLTGASRERARLPPAAAQLEFENRTSAPIRLYYLLPTSLQEHPTVRLEPGATVPVATFVGHDWRIRSETDGRLLDSYVVRAAPPEQRCVHPSVGWEWEDGPRGSGQWRAYDAEMHRLLLQVSAL